MALDAQGRPTGLNDMAVRPLTDPDGQALIPKYLADAEGLAILPNGELLVSFERDHRVWRYDREGRWLGERVIPDFPFTENEGMEGIAAAGDDAFWVSGENGGNWLCGAGACEASADSMAADSLPDDVLRPTSLIVDPNRPDRVWVLQRAYHSDRNTNTIGITQRIISDDTVRWVGVATFTAPATVDNFEGIAAVRRPDGGVRLYILSDDNFNPGQRTLLLAFDVR